MRSGDEVFIDRNSEIFVVDRIKVGSFCSLPATSLTCRLQELIKVKGFQVAPAELEGCLLDHPDVSDSCVVGVSDEYRGEIPLAFIVLSADAQKRIANDPLVVSKIKAGIIKVKKFWIVLMTVVYQRWIFLLSF